MEAPRHAQDPEPAFDDDDDLPILTEIVEDLDLPPTWSGHRRHSAAAASIFHTRPAPAPAVTTADQAGHRAAVAQHLAEKLVELDTEIARKVADGRGRASKSSTVSSNGSASVRAEMLAHLRATLLRNSLPKSAPCLTTAPGQAPLPTAPEHRTGAGRAQPGHLPSIRYNPRFAFTR